MFLLHRVCLCLLVLTVVAGCSESAAPAVRSDGKAVRNSGSEIKVHAVSIQRIAIQRRIDLSGTLASNELVKVSSEIAGTVLDANIRLGQEVHVGQILFQLDTRELLLERDRAESALRQTEAQLGMESSRPDFIPPDDQIAPVRTAIANRDEAKQKYSEAQELSGKGLIPRTDLETTRTRLKVTEAALQSAIETVRSLKASLQDRRAAVQLAQEKINDAAIRAPVSGAISERLLERGEYVRENAQVATIVQLNPLLLHTAVQEKFADVIRVNQQVQFAVESFQGRTFVGKIANLSPQVDALTRTFPVEILVENPDRKLKPGFFAQGSILTRTDNNVLAVAKEAMFTLAGVSSVFVIDNGVARQQSVTLGANEGDLFEIVDGLKGDELLAASNLSQMVTGAKVAIENGDLAAGQGGSK